MKLLAFVNVYAVQVCPCLTGTFLVFIPCALFLFSLGKLSRGCHMCAMVVSVFVCSALGPRHEQQLQARLSQVKQEIEEKGHYDLTYEELAYGARLAWRNAPRCVNRIQWRQLEVCQKLVNCYW